MPEEHRQRPLSDVIVGRSFVHPMFDLMLIGGGLSLVVIVGVLFSPGYGLLLSAATLPYFILLSNSAHFAASTVRLYTKPNVYESLPFVTMVLPIAALAVLTGVMFLAGTLGPHFTALYLTWSPYHYAAQAYGLVVMYCYRCGCNVSAENKKLLWRTAMIPFAYSFLVSPNSGLHWIDFFGWTENQAAATAILWLRRIMPPLGIAAIVYAVWRIGRSESRAMPLICAILLLANSIWWFFLPMIQAFVWATIFHGIQYLAIVIIFHVKDQQAHTGDRHGVLYHVLFFYGVSLLLGYGLFSCLPWAYISFGFGAVESVMLVAVAINIHHFIVDGYIWRLKKTDSNREIVNSGAPA